jgi:glycosyltransferase involved in cell wall biosynthesis
VPPAEPVSAATSAGTVRVLRVIARMNIGGPARHVSMLSGRLDRSRFRTLLAHGRVGAGEGSFEHLAEQEGCAVEVVAGLSPEIRPLDDLRALFGLIGAVHRFRPHIVHTHTAKAGFLGRLAAVLGPGPRPIIVHTYHGHVLEGYFGWTLSAVYRFLERRAATVSDCLIGVSQATVDDLVRLGVAPRERFRLLPIGLDLERFALPDAEAAADLRRACGVGSGEVLAACVGRLVPIKRVDLILRAVAAVRRRGVPVRLVVAGDGECRPELESLASQLGILAAVRFVGYVPDSSVVAAAADLAILASDNEGTPVALIEAAAAERPAVATSVGGVPDVVAADAGMLVPRGDHEALARALAHLAKDAELRRQMGTRARRHVLERFSIERLLRDIQALYEELLAEGPGAAGAKPPGSRTWRQARSLRSLTGSPGVEKVWALPGDTRA